MAATKRERCDMCGKLRKVRFSNFFKAFCSVECANKYLEAEDFEHRASDDDKRYKQ